jgi:glycerophosphoryl diester phosphodiesterase
MRRNQQQLTNRRPLVIAHRGASAGQPENTAAAFRRALELGVDAIELDVQVSRDGVPFVFHDQSLRRLTGVVGRAAARPWAELARLRIGGTDPIPRLADVLRLTRGRAVVQIELKAGVPVGPVVGAIRSARAEAGVILASFSPTLVRAAARLAPAIPRMLISDGNRPPATLARQLSSLHAGGLSVDHHAVRDAAWLQFFQARGFAVWCWTVNDPPMMRRLARWGANGILSDNPALLRRSI